MRQPLLLAFWHCVPDSDDRLIGAVSFVTVRHDTSRHRNGPAPRGKPPIVHNPR